MIWLYSLSSVILVSLISLVGVITLVISEVRLRHLVVWLVALAAGALFGDAIIHLIPESFELSVNPAAISFYILLGIITFFVLEKFLHWSHQHLVEKCGNDEHCHPPIKPFGYLSIIADGAHNLIDGLIIGASYLISVELGIATTLAVILHEIPQELGDFAILIQAGFSKFKVILFNLLSASVAVIGTLIALILGEQTAALTTALLPIAGGGFLYLAGSDLVPELHKTADLKKSILQFSAMTAGIVLMFALLFMD